MSKLLERMAPAFFDAMKIVLKGLGDEYQAQGHDLSGSGMRSLAPEVEVSATGITGRITGEKYLIYINTGVPANKVRYPVSIMIQYFIRRGLDPKEAKRAGWATRAVHQKEGIPSRGSYAFSHNGRRTGFIEFGVKAVKNEVKLFLEKALKLVVEVEIKEGTNVEEFVVEF